MNFSYKIISPLKQLLLLLLILSPQLILVITSTFQADQLGGISLDSKEMITKAKWLQVFSSVTFFIIPAFIFTALVIHRDHFRFLGFRKVENSGFLPLSAICILVSAPLVFWLGQINAMIHLPEKLDLIEKSTQEQIKLFLAIENWQDLLFNIFVIALVPAISEEILFRGALQGIVIRLTKNPWIGIIVAAIIFSALHLQFAGFLPRFFLGFLLGVFYYFSGTLWVPIFAHFVYNAIQVVVAAYYPDMGEQNPEVPILAAFISAALVAYFIYLFKTKSTVQTESI